MILFAKHIVILIFFSILKFQQNTVNLPPKPSTQIHIKWDSGSTLSLIYGVDKFKVVKELRF